MKAIAYDKKFDVNIIFETGQDGEAVALKSQPVTMRIDTDDDIVRRFVEIDLELNKISLTGFFPYPIDLTRASNFDIVTMIEERSQWQLISVEPPVKLPQGFPPEGVIF